MFEIKCEDNLLFMKTIKTDSLDLIYGDILYGTGNNFPDFKDLKPIKNLIYDFYVPRISEMKRILKPTGSVYLQMDWRINHWIRCIGDDIFGYNNFRNEIIWYYNSSPRKKGNFSNRHDTILRWSKTDKFKFNEDNIREPYSLSAPRGYEKEKYYNPRGKIMGDVWQINILGQNDKKERTGYSTQKPKELIKRIIETSTDKNDLVGDFFLGSGTSAVLCKELERNFIGCDINEKSIRITKERLK